MLPFLRTRGISSRTARSAARKTGKQLKTMLNGREDRTRAPMAKRRGNPNWCSPPRFEVLATSSAFEKAVKTFKLSPEQYVDSVALKDWVRANKHNKFVPEGLLQAWGFDDSREPAILLQQAARTLTD